MDAIIVNINVVHIVLIVGMDIVINVKKIRYLYHQIIIVKFNKFVLKMVLIIMNI